MLKHRKNLTVALSVLAVLLVLMAGLAYIAPSIHRQNVVPPQDEWVKSIGSVTSNKTLFGKVLARNANAIVLVAQEAQTGTSTVMVTASTTVVRDTPLSPDEMKAAYAEYKKQEAAAGGKPIQGPQTMKVETLSLSAIKPGDLVLVTLTIGSSKDHFVAERIELVPSNTVLPVAPVAAPGKTTPLP